MILQHLSLVHFRNYQTLELALHPQVTRIVGDNAQGKTNLLEALYYLGRGDSFRTSERHDLIAHDRGAAVIRAQAMTGGLIDQFAVEIAGRRRFLKNGKGVRRPDRTWPYCILFAPEETLLFRTGPQHRREYLDRLISGIDPSYRNLLRNYDRVLRQRNRLLHDSMEWAQGARACQLEPWTEQLIACGAELVVARRSWVERLQAFLPAIYAQFAACDGEIVLHYSPHVADAATFRAVLAARQDEEFVRGITVAGPQRDNLVAMVAGNDLQHFGSQGQHRSVVISLKLAEVALVQDTSGRLPILLLDDVASELDPQRLAALLETLHAMTCQIVLTTIHIGEVLQRAIPGGETVTVTGGHVAIAPHDRALSAEALDTDADRARPAGVR
ncbi:MAG: DNA replication/repair protein RecF [Deltaproteobacteria bacterium]|nr:DNA replication/repair protein RecF [Deltaproteobacteria bacterium]